MLYDIVQTGDPVLRRPARPLTAAEIATPFVQELIVLMRQTMHAAPGAGLAAPQVGEGLQVVVMENLGRWWKSRPATEIRAAITPAGDE